MNVSAVMAELAASLAAIDGLRVSSYVPGDVATPAAVVGFPEEATFDLTYGRGADRMTIPVIVLVSRISDRTAAPQLAAYLDGAGDRSIKQALEAGTPVACDSLRVMGVTVSVMAVAAIDYLTATFSVDVVG